MRKSGLGKFVRKVGAVTRPIFERRPEAVDSHIAHTHASQDLRHGHVGQRPIETEAGEKKRMVARLARERQGAITQWHAVLPSRLHSSAGDRPTTLFVADLVR